MHLPVPQLQTPIRPNYTSLAPLHQEPEEHGARRSSRNAPKLCRNANTHRHVRRALQNEERFLLSRALRRRVLGKKNGGRGFGTRTCPGAKPRRQGKEVVVRRTEIVCKENQLLSPQPCGTNSGRLQGLGANFFRPEREPERVHFLPTSLRLYLS